MTSQKSGSLLVGNPVHLYSGQLHGSPSPTTKLEDDATSGMTGDGVAISMACPISSFPKSFSRESSTHLVARPLFWIPEYYLGDDETRVVIPAVCSISSLPRSFGRESSRFCCMASLKSGSLLLRNPFYLYSGRLHGSPTTTLGDDGKKGRHSRSLSVGNPVYILWPGLFSGSPSPTTALEDDE